MKQTQSCIGLKNLAITFSYPSHLQQIQAESTNRRDPNVLLIARALLTILCSWQSTPICWDAGFR